MKLLVIILVLSLATTFVLSAPTEDSSSMISSPTPAPAQNEARATAAGANIIDAHAHLVNSSFTCFNRQVGYYADTDADCKLYHFCMLGDYNGQEIYQRVSYMCINETMFDQKALDCVEVSKMTTPCDQSDKFYDESNAALRKAIIGQSNMNAEKKEEAKKAEEKKEEEKKDEEKKAEENKEHEKKNEHEDKTDDEDKKDDDKKENEKKEG